MMPLLPHPSLPSKRAISIEVQLSEYTPVDSMGVFYDILK